MTNARLGATAMISGESAMCSRAVLTAASSDEGVVPWPGVLVVGAVDPTPYELQLIHTQRGCGRHRQPCRYPTRGKTVEHSIAHHNPSPADTRPSRDPNPARLRVSAHTPNRTSCERGADEPTAGARSPGRTARTALEPAPITSSAVVLTAGYGDHWSITVWRSLPSQDVLASLGVGETGARGSFLMHVCGTRGGSQSGYRVPMSTVSNWWLLGEV